MRIFCHRQALPRGSECPSHPVNACIFCEVRPEGAIGSFVSIITRFHVSHAWDTTILSHARDSMVPNYSFPRRLPGMARQAGQTPHPSHFLSGVMTRVQE